jgi:DNA-binding PadR family transcriptional regulator
MSLAHAILVCIADEPMTGYELAKRFDHSVGFFWRANHQQIYRELRLLGEKAWVLGKTVAQESRPNKTIYAITEQGRAELYSWSGFEADLPSIKEEFLLKFYALDRVDIDALTIQVVKRGQQHRERLALYEKILERHYQNEATLSRVAKGKLMGLKAGLMTERGWLAWCKDALLMLKTLETGS